MRRSDLVTALVCGTLGLLAGFAPAAEFESGKLAAIRDKMQKYVDQQVVSGAVTVIGSKDGVASIEAVGQQDVEGKKPMAVNSLFRIASMTKPITAIGIMILEQERKLSVDDPVEKYLPEFKGQKLVYREKIPLVTPKVEPPKVEKSKTEKSKTETSIPAAKATAQPKVAPKAEAPKAATPKTVAPNAAAPKTAAPKAAESKPVESKEVVKLVDPPRPITIRDLLTHTSGLPGGFPAPNGDLYFKRQLTLKEAVDISAHQPLDFLPGSKWAYCNAGIDTLGRIIEVVSGQSYESFLTSRIFAPLGMTDTTFYPSDDQLQRLASLYDQKEGKLTPVGYVLLGPTKDAKHPIPAGGLYSTAPDLAKLYQMMLNRGALGTKRILTGHSAGEMTKVQTAALECGFTPGMGFGYGWAVVRKPQGVHSMMSAGTYGHGGAFGTQAWIDPQRDVFVVLLIQRTGMPNADGSDLRRDLQLVAVDALKKPQVQSAAK